MAPTTKTSSAFFAVMAIMVSGCIGGDEVRFYDGYVGPDPDEPVASPAAQPEGGCEGRAFEGDFAVDTAADLLELAPYSFVTGRVTISGTRLESLDGLGCLTEVGGLHVVGNWDLESLEGLGSLERVHGDLWIRGNRALADLGGLDSLVEVSGEVDVVDNDAMADVEGLGSLTTVGGDLTISDNAALEQVDGLISIDIVGGSLEISRNEAMTSAEGLDGVWSVGRSLVVEENDELVEIEMGTIFGVGYEVAIARNPKLPSCMVELIADQIRSSEFNTATEYDFGGNDDHAVCRPER